MDNKVVKTEFFNIFNITSYCHACLSTDRALTSLGDYIDIFYKICDYHIMMLPTGLALCWECMALLKKVKMFIKKVADAQKIMQFYQINKQGPFPNCLTNLSQETIPEPKVFTHEDNEFKILPEIKEEPDFDDHYEDYDVKNTEEFNIDIKEENVQSEIKLHEFMEPVDESNDRKIKMVMKMITKRRAKYRFLNSKLKKHRDALIIKVPVSLGEAKCGLERERNRDEFKNAKYKCNYCVATWEQEDKLISHNEKYHNQAATNVCEVCHSRFQSPSKMTSHLCSHRSALQCRECRVQCHSPALMKSHLLTHDKMVQCVACGLCFSNVRVFYYHYKALHAEFVCDLCGKRCKTKAIVEKHLRCHFGYECKPCSRSFKNTRSYKNHVDTVHLQDESECSYCVQCDRQFRNDKLYRRHLQSSAAHAPERDSASTKRQFPCPACPNVYSRKTYMNNHYRHVHSRQSRHYCADCDRHFLNRTRFVDHRRYQHEGAKRKKDKLCNICGRGFAANRTLVNHLRTHSGERPFPCEHCGAKFTQKHAMLAHTKHVHLKKKNNWRE